jgi:hypothetical protein
LPTPPLPLATAIKFFTPGMGALVSGGILSPALSGGGSARNHIVIMDCVADTGKHSCLRAAI